MSETTELNLIRYELKYMMIKYGSRKNYISNQILDDGIFSIWNVFISSHWLCQTKMLLTISSSESWLIIKLINFISKYVEQIKYYQHKVTISKSLTSRAKNDKNEYSRFPRTFEIFAYPV